MAISPSILITSTTRAPARAYETTTAGPAAAIALADPTNRPAPMTPAMEIIVMWRGFRAVSSPPR